MITGGEVEERAGVREYLAVLRRRWLLVAFATVVVLAASLGSSLVETPRYGASALVAVESSNVGSGLGLAEDELTPQELETQVQVLLSEAVADRAAERLGLDVSGGQLLGRVFAGVVSDTRVLQVTATDVAPDRAAAIANAFAEAYLEHRREQGLSRVLDASASLRARTTAVQARLDELETQVGETPPGEERQSLVRQQETLEEQLAQLGAQLSVLEATDAFVRGGGEVIRRATSPSTPLSPDPVRDGVLGLVAGLLLGAGLALGREWLDDAVRTDAHVTAAGAGPVLSHVPVFDTATRAAPLPLLNDPDSAGSEAIRTLRTNLRFAAGRVNLRTVLVSSPGPADGKSTVAANLAIAMAHGGVRVLLLDADMRRPSVHRAFGVANGRGTSTLLTGEDGIDDVRVDVGVPNLSVVTAGVSPPNPAELLGGLGPTLGELMRDVDVVIVDAPPVLALADALEAASTCDGVLLVLAHGETGRRETREAAMRVRRVGGAVLGSVLNLSPHDTNYYYGAYRAHVERADASLTPARGRR